VDLIAPSAARDRITRCASSSSSRKTRPTARPSSTTSSSFFAGRCRPLLSHVQRHNYCPDSVVTHPQMAIFLAKALSLHWPF